MNDFEERAVDLAEKGGHEAVVEVLRLAEASDPEDGSGGGGSEVRQHSNPLLGEARAAPPGKEEAIAQVRGCVNFVLIFTGHLDMITDVHLPPACAYCSCFCLVVS